MRVVVTAVGPNHWGLADPIIHYITSVGATIAEIQMYDHAAEGVSALMLRCQWPGRPDTLAELRARMAEVGAALRRVVAPLNLGDGGPDRGDAVDDRVGQPPVVGPDRSHDHSHDDPPVSGPRFAHTGVDPASGPKARRGYGPALAAGGVGSSRSIRSNNFPSPVDSSTNQTGA